MRYFSKARIEAWLPDHMLWSKEFTDTELKAFRQFCRVDLLQVRALRDAGAGILSGTDTLPGFSIHDEFEYLEQAGLSRYEVLVTATRNPAKFLHSEGKFGSILVGSRADLLLLDGNPLDALYYLRSPAGVMLRGRWFPKRELDARLNRIARDVKFSQL
jgi:imidazolonepropionase-like amidohydrolase